MSENSHFEMDAFRVYDCIGVGFGPSNIALAIALEETGQLDNVLFLEKAPALDWQGEFLIEGSDIQHNPLRDLVTPRNPASPYGFLSYLKAQNRLFDFLNLEAPFPPRQEYSRYVVWVSRQLDRVVRYSSSICEVRYELENVKFSTRRGQLIWASEIIKVYPADLADLVRFYTALSSPGFEQGNFNTTDMQDVIERRLLAPYRCIAAHADKHTGSAVSSDNVGKINAALGARVASHLSLDRFNLQHGAEDALKGLEAIEKLQMTSGLNKAEVIQMLLNWAEVVTPLMPELAGTLIRALRNGQVPADLLPAKGAAPAPPMTEVADA
jgi:leucyl-tRNA synthetase